MTVTAPVNATQPLPVLYWIYGGGYVLGDSNEFGLYDPVSLVEKTQCIVVAVNYRVGPFGFMALEGLVREDAQGSTGNAGLQDQTLGLQWVQQNIGYFGGDASRVTIFGESAGGFSVAWHLVSEASAGLFSGAIMESGSTDSPQFFQTMDEAVSFNTLYSAAVGCNATQLYNGSSPSSFPVGQDPLVNCLRALPTQDVMKSVEDWLNPNWPFTSTALAGAEEEAGAGLRGAQDKEKNEKKAEAPAAGAGRKLREAMKLPRGLQVTGLPVSGVGVWGERAARKPSRDESCHRPFLPTNLLLLLLLFLLFFSPPTGPGPHHALGSCH